MSYFSEMLNILLTVILLYLSIILITFITTVFLILLGSGWGNLPHKYLNIVLSIRELFSKYNNHYLNDTSWIERDIQKCVLARSQSTITSKDMQFQFDLDKENLLSTFDLGIDLAQSGIQAIAQVRR